MIAFISGRLIHKTPESIVVDVSGVGYEIIVPMSTFYLLPELEDTVSLRVHTNVREDAIQLFGFLTAEEKDAFQLLISVSGVGPKLARNILSGISVGELVASIGSSDKARLGTIPGIGAKSAERLILELKDKVAGFAKQTKPQAAEPKDDLASDVVSALDNLGYKSTLSEEAVKKARVAFQDGQCGFEELFKESLKLLAKR